MALGLQAASGFIIELEVYPWLRFHSFECGGWGGMGGGGGWGCSVILRSESIYVSVGGLERLRLDGVRNVGFIHRPLSSSFLGLPYRTYKPQTGTA